MHLYSRGGLVAASLALALSAGPLSGCNNQKADGGAAKGEAAPGAPLKTNEPAPAPTKKAMVKQPGTPAKAAPAGAAPGSQPAAAPGSQPAAMPAGHPPAAGSQPSGAMPAGHPPAGSQPMGQAPGSIKGVIKLDDRLKEAAAAGKVLFIVVRKDAGEGQKGQLLAVRKLPVKPGMFPLQFSVDQSNVMLQGTIFAGSVRVEARIDGDGDAISRLPGDVLGKAGKVYKVGATDVELTLDQKME